MRLIIPCILALVLLLATGCSSGPKIDGSTPEAFAASMQHAGEALEPKQQSRFASAVALVTMKVGMKAASAGNDPTKALMDELDGLSAEQVIELADRMAEAAQ